MTEALKRWNNSVCEFNFEGIQISYQAGGQGSNLLLIHGFPTSSFDFDPMWPGLTEVFSCLVPDLIGMGNSDKPDRPISVMLQADMLEAICKNQGWSEAHILAHDLGDTVAQELLARGTSKISWLSCTFLNGGLFPEKHQPILIQKLLLSPLGKWVAQLSSKKTFRKNMQKIFSPKHPPTEDFLSDSWSLFERNNGKRALPRLIRYMSERKTHRDRWVGAIQHTDIPIILINGSLDPISGRHAAVYYEKMIPNPQVIHLAELGHYPHVESPESVLDAFLNFHKELAK